MGNSIQIIQISKIFFSYEVNTIVKITQPSSKFTPPSVCLCYYLVDLIVWNDAFTKFPQLKDVLPYDPKDRAFNKIIAKVNSMEHNEKLNLTRYIMDNVTAGVVFEMTLTKEQIFDNCTYVNPVDYSLNQRPCIVTFKITTYITEVFKCFLFDPNYSNNSYMFMESMRIPANNGLNFIIRMLDRVAGNRTDQVEIFYTETAHIPRHGDSNYVFITKLQNKDFSFTYTEFQNTLLPNPYETQCIEYREEEHGTFENQGHCYEACARNQSLKEFGYLMPGPSVHLGKVTINEKLMSIMTVQGSREINLRMLKIQDRCDYICRYPACNQLIFSPVLLSENENTENSFHGLVARSPTVRTEYQPKLDLIEYLTQVSSTFGFWTGVSCFALFDLYEPTLEFFKYWKSASFLKSA